MKKCSTWNIADESGVFSSCFRQNAEKLGLTVSNELIDSFHEFYLLVCKFNRVLNLTRITDPEEAAVQHFIDSVLASSFLPEKGNVLDVGSGAGFPGMVLALMNPGLNFTLLDASLKRIDFLKIVKSRLKTDNVNLVHGRWPEDVESDLYDAITSRATFSDLSAFAHARQLLKNEGTLVLLTSNPNDIHINGFEFEIRKFRLEQLKNDRYIITGRMVSENG